MGERPTGGKSHIPEQVKRTVRTRQHHRCMVIDPHVCTGHIDQFDHIINVKTLGVDRRDANDPDNLQGLCTPCHKVKTQAEAKAGRNRWKRQPEQHPGAHPMTDSKHKQRSELHIPHPGKPPRGGHAARWA